MIREKVLLNVLKLIGSGKENDAAPDDDYLKALESIGLINLGWDNRLTSMGQSVLNLLQNKLYP